MEKKPSKPKTDKAKPKKPKAEAEKPAAKTETAPVETVASTVPPVAETKVAKKEAKPPKEEAAPAETPRENLSLDADDVEKPKIVKAKGSKNVHSGIAHVFSTFNNTIVTITDLNGNVIGWSSAGKKGGAKHPPNTTTR